MVHIVGMGLMGSFLAWELERQGVVFTWNDTNARHTAWRASTGCIYPSGDPVDQANYVAWERWYHDAPWKDALPDVMERAAYWFLSKHPPHGGAYRIAGKVGRLSLASIPSYHLHAQRFVMGTRAAFIDRRRDGRGGAETVIVSHGFDPRRMVRALWGWTVPVALKIDPQIQALSGAARPCLYLREGRFALAYAYPMSGESLIWYAGSSLISQHTLRSLEIAPKFARWREHVERVSDGMVRIVSCGRAIEGWRPAGDDIDDTASVRMIDGDMVLRPLWNSGIRHAPLQISAAVDALRTGARA